MTTNLQTNKWYSVQVDVGVDNEINSLHIRVNKKVVCTETTLSKLKAIPSEELYISSGLKPKANALVQGVTYLSGGLLKYEIFEYLEVFVVQGLWSKWSSWSTCNKECDGGHNKRTRTCSTATG